MGVTHAGASLCCFPLAVWRCRLANGPHPGTWLNGFTLPKPLKGPSYGGGRHEGTAFIPNGLDPVSNVASFDNRTGIIKYLNVTSNA